MVIDGKPVMAETKRLADVVYDRLCESIVDGTLAPGQRVRDGELADRLGVSRMPVREALQRLERQGLVEMVASRYTRVTDVTPEMPAQSFEFFGYQVGVATLVALPRLDDEQRAEAARLAEDIAAAVSAGPEDVYHACHVLWTYFADHSGNALLRTVLDDAWLTLTRTLRGQFPALKSDDDARADFTELGRRIAGGDANAAEEQVRHIFLLGPGQPGPSGAVAHLWDDTTE